MKKRGEDLKGRAGIDEMRSFVAAGQAAQEAVEEFEDAEQIFERFGGEVLEYCRRLKRKQLHFQEQKINPFQRLQVICQEKCLIFQDNFDKVAGMKAKE